MSLLLKALKHAERSSDLTLEPMDTPNAKSAAPPSAQAAADLMFAKQAAAERRRLTILLVSLGVVVIGMAVYFYLAIYMPWIFLPRPPGVSTPVAVVNTVPAPLPETSGMQNSAPTPDLTQAPTDMRSRQMPPTASPPSLPATPARTVQTDKAPVLFSKDQTGSLEPELSQKPRVAIVPPIAQSRPPADRESNLRTERAPREKDIQIAANSMSPLGATGILSAYQMLQAGQYEDARRAYEKLAAVEPRNPDILLGLALIAQRQGRNDDAVQLYLRALDVDPKNNFAQANLTSMVARADPAAAEAKFKSLLAQQPAAYLYFGLGNVYAAQGKWPEAQQAYFDAQRLAPDVADYAYNLAIGLEHIHQTRAALDYYARALMLTRVKGGGSFDVSELKARIQRLNNALPAAPAN